MVIMYYGISVLSIKDTGKVICRDGGKCIRSSTQLFSQCIDMIAIDVRISQESYKFPFLQSAFFCQ